MDWWPERVLARSSCLLRYERVRDLPDHVSTLPSPLQSLCPAQPFARSQRCRAIVCVVRRTGPSRDHSPTHFDAPQAIRSADVCSTAAHRKLLKSVSKRRCQHAGDRKPYVFRLPNRTLMLVLDFAQYGGVNQTGTWFASQCVTRREPRHAIGK